VVCYHRRRGRVVRPGGAAQNTESTQKERRRDGGSGTQSRDGAPSRYARDRTAGGRGHLGDGVEDLGAERRRRLDSLALAQGCCAGAHQGELGLALGARADVCPDTRGIGA
jgi:hypothetical protein